MKRSMRKIALAAVGMLLSAMLLLTGCGEQTPAPSGGQADSGTTTETPETQTGEDEPEVTPVQAKETLLFAPMATGGDQQVWNDSLWLYCPINVTNLSEQAVVLKDLVMRDSFWHNVYRCDYDLKTLYADSTLTGKSVTVRTQNGETPCIVVAENGTSRTLPAGQSRVVAITVLAPRTSGTLNVYYNGVYQCSIQYEEAADEDS